MPTSAADKPWYSFASGPVHFTVMSTEHNWTSGSEQVSINPLPDEQVWASFISAFLKGFPKVIPSHNLQLTSNPKP
jgi:hypothetical protein